MLREYLAQALQPRSTAGRNTPNIGTDLLPNATRRAALRAVRDGALGKAARILSQDSHPLPHDLEGALRSLHPPATEPIPTAADIPVGEDFTVEELTDCLRTFPPGSAGFLAG